jgi:hypothetical protein
LSRLVFYVPDDKLPIDWTIEGMLKAMRELELSVPANALPPKKRASLISDVLVFSLNQALLTTDVLAAFAGATTGLSTALRPEETQLSAMQMSLQASAGPPIANASRVIAVARVRRKVRTIGNALGLTNVTAPRRATSALLPGCIRRVPDLAFGCFETRVRGDMRSLLRG